MLTRLLALTLVALPALAQPTFVERLNEIPTPKRLRAWHDMVASRPHIAGTEGDRHVIGELARTFETLGYETGIHEFWPLLSYPVAAEVEVLHPSIPAGAGVLPLQEVPLPQDGYSDDPSLTIGFNAYSGSGEAIGEVVYANFGRKEDFKRLAGMGVDCTGKIVLARYGGNYRGYKAKFAEAAGAAGLLIYLDPGDTGFVKGDVYPDGGWQTDSCIQRGSINTLPYQGDPLTPFVEATEDAERFDPDEIDLPRIPVQPIGWGAARQIIVRMRGPECPDDWRGGLPMSYPLTGGEDLRVRVMVEQERRIEKTANVVARMEGALYPDEWVIVGCHHDAWGFGACDPTCGLISLLECARSFAELAQDGRPPDRTIVFCAWGAEEFGIIGSSEWVEANASELRQKAVAYINLDMASMGPQFRASASPSVRGLVEHSARLVPQARDHALSVFDDWLSRAPRADDPSRPTIGDLGGGSDHVGFVCHLGVPGISLGCGGSAGTAYHTAYDNLNWYRQVVGEDYEPALMIARMTNAIAGELCSSVAPSLGVGAQMESAVGSIEALSLQHPGVGLEASLERLRQQHDELNELEAQIVLRLGRLDPRSPLLTDRERGVTGVLLVAQRAWALEGVPERPWYRNGLVATDPDSGYGTQALPHLQAALRSGDSQRVAAVLARYEEVGAEQLVTLRGLLARLPED